LRHPDGLVDRREAAAHCRRQARVPLQVAALDVARAVELSIREPSMTGRAFEMPGPENLSLDGLVGIAQAATGITGRVSHTPPPVMRVLALLLRPVRPVIARQIAAALVMDSCDMTADGPAIRAALPSIPMTTASEVAARLFLPASDAEPATHPA
jgi:hypothetical protein